MTHLHLGLLNLVLGNGHNIAVENDEIGVFPNFDAAFAVFEETAFGHPNRDGTQGLFAGQGILHLEALGGRAVQMHAGDGSIEGVDGADVLDGKVGAVNDPTVLLQQLLVGIGVLDALAETLIGPVHVGGAVCGLDGGNDGKVTIALEVGLVHHL